MASGFPSGVRELPVPDFGCLARRSLPDIAAERNLVSGPHGLRSARALANASEPM